MANLSDYFENKILDHMFRAQAFTPPATLYLALFTAVTGLEANNPTLEVSGGAYARQTVALDAASAGATQNSADVTFPQATASWGTISHVAIVDHATNTNWGVGVNVLAWGALTATKVVDNGDTFKVLQGDLDLSVA